MTPKTVAIGAALVVGGVVLGMNYADALWGGPYGLSSAGSIGATWRMNQRTGQVSLCFIEGASASDFTAETPPVRRCRCAATNN